MSKRPIAAPFEVSRSVILDPLGSTAFCGAAAVRGFRDAWSARQESAELGAGLVAHPMLSGHVVPLLRRDEVAAALTLEEDAAGEPVFDLKRAQKLAHYLGKACSSSQELQNVPPASQLEARLDGESRWNLVLPLTAEETGEIIGQLQEERTVYLDVLFDVTGYIPSPRVPIGLGIARFDVGQPAQIRAICEETQRTLTLAHERGLSVPLSDDKLPLGPYGLAPAQILD